MTKSSNENGVIAQDMSDHCAVWKTIGVTCRGAVAGRNRVMGDVVSVLGAVGKWRAMYGELELMKQKPTAVIFDDPPTELNSTSGKPRNRY